MADENILKGVFKEGALIASVIQKGENSRIMLKGAEPRDPTFKEDLKKATDGCRPHVENFSERELIAVLIRDPIGAEATNLVREDLQSLGLTKLSLMDGSCGVMLRVIEAEPAPIPLAYTSLRSSNGLPDQPGQVEIPPAIPRKSHKDLSDPQRKIFEAAAQMAGRGLVRLVCVEDDGLKLLVTVKDAPPIRARSVLVPLGSFADDLAAGTPFEEIVKRLAQLRA
jgi:hypothetical protein